ncbi:MULTISPECIES: glutamate 5-kinase [Planococcus]|uniref:Glutamate 5-kinase n=2 Tax=Planococcus TaxID=1372 RepID=A0ABM5WSW9_9BACL|nr:MULTISPECIES: glutamate 5-kinase [Planococcus]ALS77262.1 glutamate 5-kinase [Planococcus kocurii]AQU80863.1 glutamate 5-kinase [Planococcus faecalis]KAA0956208.1 glutamate 5-kinase [Planococcus sp. ANT_H30]MDJ0332217.1 glutamate 5-kinase [Planococcus sp. S3-L1]OHX55841.1 glutamate 5-kinase [Planococcus faecalis]
MEKKRIVVKIGSSSLTDDEGKLSIEKLREHVDALASLRTHGHEVILISSGAVAAGCMGMGYLSRPDTVVDKQSAAAVGQSLLSQAYADECKKHRIVAAQLLLTKDLYKNANATISKLLERNVLPIINENDSVSAEELTFGDNDMLSALVSGLVHADILMILTDINGIYQDNPRTNPQAQKYLHLHEIPDELIDATSSDSSTVGTGGMKSKVEAARTALAFGVQVFIGSGTGSEKLVDIFKGKGDGTYIGVKTTMSV